MSTPTKEEPDLASPLDEGIRKAESENAEHIIKSGQESPPAKMEKADREQTDPNKFITRESVRVRETDDSFFEKFGSRLAESAEVTDSHVVEDVVQQRIAYQLESDTSSSAAGDSITIAEANAPWIHSEDLYGELLFECGHLVGADVHSGVKKDALFSYLKKSFKYDDEMHKKILDSIKNKQVPKRQLVVEVMEAKDLPAKDSNGYSDPFCTLWMSSAQTERYSSSVKYQTLRPIWEEQFTLPLSSTSSDTLHCEVWDFDPAESVKDKVSKIKNVKGIWGFKRMVKEIAVTASTGKHDNELIGSAQISIKNLPASGQTAWFNLQKKQKATGMILLKIMFASEKDTQIAIDEHRLLVRTILLHEMTLPDFNMDLWTGKFSDEAELILRQHCAQSSLGITDGLLAKWIEYIDVHVNHAPVNFAVICALLKGLLDSLQSGRITPEENKLFWNGVAVLLPSCYNTIRKIRKCEPENKIVQRRLLDVLSILRFLLENEMASPVDLFPTSTYGWLTKNDERNIKSVLHDAVIQGTVDWFRHLHKSNKPKDSTDDAVLKALVRIAQFVLLDLQAAQDHFDKIFKQTVHFPYAKTIYTVYECKISELVEPIVADMCMTMKPIDFERRNEQEANNDPLNMGTTMFELYLGLQRINKIGASLFGPDNAIFKLPKFYDWFYTGVVRWLDIAAYKALQRIEKAIELDPFTPIDSTVEYSASAVDTMAIYYQVKTFWHQLAWPDIEGSYTFIAKIIDDICKCSVHYADKVAERVENEGNTNTTYERVFEVTDEWCVAINNIRYIHTSIEPFVNNLGLEKTLDSLADFKSSLTAEHCRDTLQAVLDNTMDNVSNKIAELLEKVAKNMVPGMTKFLQEGAEILHQQSNVIDRLMMYLDDNLIKLNAKLPEDIFEQQLNVIWEKLSEVLSYLVRNGIEKRRPPSFFSNLDETLHLLIGFFQRSEATVKEANPSLAQVMKTLHLYGMETLQLIHHYYLKRCDQQKDLEKSDDGIMSVRAQYVVNTLHVQILNARNVRKMDSNGFCDPFVILRLLPKKNFQAIKLKTKVQKKTLSPLFDETFKIPLTKDEISMEDGMIMFVMKDQDLFGAKNQYMAESFIPFGSIEHADQESLYKTKQFQLFMNRPSKEDCEILNALDFRQGDKLAKDFVKRQKVRMEIPA